MKMKFCGMRKKSMQIYDNNYKCSVTAVILVLNGYGSSIILKTASFDRTIEKNWAWFLYVGNKGEKNLPMVESW